MPIKNTIRRFARGSRIAVFAIALAGTLLSVTSTRGQDVDPQQSVLVYELDGAISQATVDALDGALQTAEEEGHSALLIELDTPGGLVESMREMVQMILSSPVPVLVWVGPGGARAASAGVFLVAASHAAAMSPQSTMGAASPVGMGGKDIDETMKSKVVNDLSALIRTLAQSRGRNVDWYVRSVTEAHSATAQEAALNGVVEVLAADPTDFISQIDARGGIVFGGGRIRFNPQTLRFTDFDPGLRHTILSWILQPQVAYLLLLGGMAGLFFEFSTPGAIFPGVFGGLCLLLGLYAMSILPTNVAGVLLIVFALVLLVLEIYVTSFGMLGLAALAALFFGSTILFDPGGGVDPLPLTLIGSTVATVGAILAACMVLIVRVQRQRSMGGTEGMIGQTARVISWTEGQGRVFVRGETWKARGPLQLQPESIVIIRDIQGLVAIVTSPETDQ